MKRRHVHLLFGLTALAFGLLAGYHGVRLQRAERLNAAIASSNAEGFGSKLPEAGGGRGGGGSRARGSGKLPEAALARAVVLSRAGDYEAAVKTYKALIHGGRVDLRRIALYNLGNLHMHQALQGGSDAALESLPLVELAKQSYRDLLREHPGDWDARYNLERTLWLTPEVAEEGNDESRPTHFQRRTVRALPDFRLELP
jgi:mxaK protein